MFSRIRQWLVGIGQRLKLMISAILPDRAAGTSDAREQEGDTACRACGDLFFQRFRHHHLCDRCADVWVKCWSDTCHTYLEPRDGRASITYCKTCRETGLANDLMSELLKGGPWAEKANPLGAEMDTTRALSREIVVYDEF